MSRVGYEAMIGNKRSVACPVSGCSSKWQKGSATKDQNFQLRLERFFRVQANTATATADERGDAVDVELEDDDYTQI
jgi:hypothetical protein